MADDDLRTRAERWIADDPDPRDREELRALLADPQGGAELADRFAGSLGFGTAGLRGVLGAGPNRMNRAVVARATWALGQELLARVPGAADRGVVVGRDGRRMSRELAEDVAAILAAAGLRVVSFAEPVPTPLVGFAVKQLGAAGGVVVTASHNPPEYNGYKIYWENAAQIAPPVDEWLAAAIDRAPPARDVPRPSIAEAMALGRLRAAPPEIERAYLDAVAELAVHPGQGDRALRIVYTPLHGVGDALARRALARAGFTNVTSVPSQAQPDPLFPTVAFPNPEEPGALDRAIALAGETGADLVLANDPDADRLAVAVRDPVDPRGFVPLTGNDVGVLLGEYLLTERPPSARPRAVLASIVSSPLLGRIARSLGVHYEETLTGFKWIATRSIELRRAGYDVVFGYEEALGYALGDVVRDKDGVSAAVLVAELAAVLRARGSSLRGRLEDIARRFGAFASVPRSVTFEKTGGVAEIAAAMSRLRASAPRAVAGDEVISVSDYQAGTALDRRGGARAALTLPRSNVLAFGLASGARVVARPSGTEPKAKVYVDTCVDVGEGETALEARERARLYAERLADAFVAMTRAGA